ncbi:uncharacterized protein LOC110092045 [Dendrobium catenatum]|uniref:uncharacterized protein LOC110092045 n=1 Tax=Dendrobium catenatum TaxID=906689 RepID=UPI0010A089E9|nr:uncharacterized protein LOC110092045 [Dendrobium catenatum]
MVKLHLEKEQDNSNRLKKFLVIKVFGSNIPFNIISIELRKQWARIGKFHLTRLGLGWVLCAFEENDSLEEIIASGPWYVNGNIVGMDRRAVAFSPSSFKGFMAPIWIRMPSLPLQRWDEVNVCRIASMLGTPYLIDENMFQWSRREFTRVCVRIKLDEKLSLGVWVKGNLGKLYQSIEYERLPTFCFNCGKLGHLRKECLKKMSPIKQNQVVEAQVSKDKLVENFIVTEPKTKSQALASNNGSNGEVYGPWIHLNYKKKKVPRSLSTKGEDRILKATLDKNSNDFVIPSTSNVIEAIGAKELLKPASMGLVDQNLDKEGEKKRSPSKDDISCTGVDIQRKLEKGHGKNFITEGIPGNKNKFEALNNIAKEGESSREYTSRQSCP